ncbi:hypothetical protein DXG03_002662 [Asterophora parasitica]|uniref:Uncharacterized protein n=1 Tax=Asterophora parasitica TaxID=117018 RepID=A0A9P7GGG1_9AGAR|nr:hypothetical protein DXG03_002662 [Asterophora parasitica]
MTDTILFVKEAKTCSYVLVINTPRLCGEPGFKSHRDTGEEHQIRCREIVDTQPPAGTSDAHANLPDTDIPLKFPRRKSNLPPPAVKQPKVKVDGVEIKDLAYSEVLRKTLEAIMTGSGKDAKNVELQEVIGDDDNVVFELVEEFELEDGQLKPQFDKIREALKAVGYDVKGLPNKAQGAAGNGKKGDKRSEKEQAQVQNKKGKSKKVQNKGRWQEEL